MSLRSVIYPQRFLLFLPLLFVAFLLLYCNSSVGGTLVLPEGEAFDSTISVNTPLAIYYAGKVSGDKVNSRTCASLLLSNTNLQNDAFVPYTAKILGSTSEYNFRDIFTSKGGFDFADSSQVQVYYYANSQSSNTPTRELLTFNAKDLNRINEKGEYAIPSVQTLFKSYLSKDTSDEGDFYTFTNADGTYDTVNNCAHGTSKSADVLGAIGSVSNEYSDNVLATIRKQNFTKSAKPCNQEHHLFCLATRDKLDSEASFVPNPVPLNSPFVLQANTIGSLTNRLIPTEFSQRHENNFPSLVWRSAPTKAKSLALVATQGEDVHLFLYNIPFSESFVIPKISGFNPDFNTVWSSGVVVGFNSFPGINGGRGWAGTSLPGRPYKFTLYALGQANLPLFPAPTISDLENPRPPFSFIAKAYLVANATSPFSLISKKDDRGFDQGGLIPEEFSSQAQNNFPKLSWVNTPPEVGSYVLIVSNSINGSNLILYDIPKSRISLDWLPGTLPTPPSTSFGSPDFPSGYGKVAQNSFGIRGWTGIASSVDYTFTLFAMRWEVAPAPPTSYSSFVSTYGPSGSNQIIDSAVITATGASVPLSITSVMSVRGAKIFGFNPDRILDVSFSQEVAGGLNHFPLLNWKNGPSVPKLKSYVLAVVGQNKTYALLYGIPPEYTGLPFTDGPNPEIAISNNCPTCVWATNSFGKAGWSGPERGGVELKFILYALNTNTYSKKVSSPSQFEVGGDYAVYILNRTSDRAVTTGVSSPPFSLTSGLNTHGGGFIPDTETQKGDLPLEFNAHLNTPSQKGNFPSLNWSAPPSLTLSYVLVVKDKVSGAAHLLLSNYANEANIINKQSNEPIPIIWSTVGLVAQNSFGRDWSGFVPGRTYQFNLYALNVANIDPATHPVLSIANYTDTALRVAYSSILRGVARTEVTASISPLGLWSSVASVGGFASSPPSLSLQTMPIEFNQTSSGGANNFPYIAWYGGSSVIKSYVLAVTRANRTHLLLHGIPNTSFELPRILGPNPNFRAVCPTCVATMNDFEVNGWSGPNSMESYTFKLYALDTSDTTTIPVNSVAQFELGGNYFSKVRYTAVTTARGSPPFSLSSSLPNGFQSTENVPVPHKFQALGGHPEQKNDFPFLNWSNAPNPTSTPTRSYALVVTNLENLQAQALLSNIPFSNAGIPQTGLPYTTGPTPGAHPIFTSGCVGCVWGENSFGVMGWTGFAPEGRYRIQLYALNTPNLNPPLSLTTYTASSFSFYYQPFINGATYLDVTTDSPPLYLWSTSNVGEGFLSSPPALAPGVLSHMFSNPSIGGLNFFPKLHWIGGGSLIKSYALSVTGANGKTQLLLYGLPKVDTLNWLTSRNTIERLDFSGGTDFNNGCGGVRCGLLALNSNHEATWSAPDASVIYTFRIFGLDTDDYSSLRVSSTSQFEEGGDFSKPGAQHVLSRSSISVRGPTPFILNSNQNISFYGGGFTPLATDINASMPVRFNADTNVRGQLNHFPALAWSNNVSGVQSYVLIVNDVTDPANPTSNLLLSNIPRTSNFIRAQTSDVVWATIGSITNNSSGTEWKGFSPERTYKFRLYAMNVAVLNPPLTIANSDETGFMSTYGVGVRKNLLAYTSIQGRAGVAPLVLWSSVGLNTGFASGPPVGLIPSQFNRYGFGGINSFPQLYWNGGSDRSIGSYALSVTSGIGANQRTHLMLYNIPNHFNGLPRVVGPMPDVLSVCPSCQWASTSFSSEAWTGAFTNPSYEFKLYALRNSDYSTTPAINLDRAEFERNYNSFIFASSQTSIRGSQIFRLSSSENGLRSIMQPPASQVMSLEFNNNTIVPSQRNSFPQLQWLNTAPPGTESFILIVTDDDTGEAHLILKDIAKTNTNIPKMIDGVNIWLTIGALETNSFDKVGWTGFNSNRNYRFSLYAMTFSTLPNTFNLRNIYREEDFISTFGGNANNAILGLAVAVGRSATTPLTLWSSASAGGFDAGTPIPIEFSQVDKNYFPNLKWAGGTSDVRSYVLYVTRGAQLHLLLYDIPVNIIGSELPRLTFNGTSTFLSGCNGPCGTALVPNPSFPTFASGWAGPGVGGSYTFTLYALNTNDYSATIPTTTSAFETSSYRTAIGNRNINKAVITVRGVDSFQMRIRNSKADTDIPATTPLPVALNGDTLEPGQTNSFPYIGWSNQPSGTLFYTLVVIDKVTSASKLILANIPNNINNEILAIAGPNPNFTTGCINQTTLGVAPCGELVRNSSGATNWSGLDSGKVYQFNLYALNSRMNPALIADLATNFTDDKFKSTFGRTGHDILNGPPVISTISIERTAGNPPFTGSSSSALNGFDPLPALVPNPFLATNIGGLSQFPRINWSGGPSTINSYIVAVVDTAGTNSSLLLTNISSSVRGINIQNSDTTASYFQGASDCLNRTGGLVSCGPNFNIPQEWSGLNLASTDYRFYVFGIDRPSVNFGALSPLAVINALQNNNHRGVNVLVSTIMNARTGVGFTIDRVAGSVPSTTTGLPIRFNSNLGVTGQLNDFPGLQWSATTPVGTRSLVLVVNQAGSFANLLLRNIDGTPLPTQIPLSPATAGPAFTCGACTTLPNSNGVSWTGFQQNRVYDFSLYALDTTSLQTARFNLSSANYSNFTPGNYNSATSNILGIARVNVLSGAPPLTFISSETDGGFTSGNEISSQFATSSLGGGNAFPKLRFWGGPVRTQSYAIAVRKLGGSGSTHFILYNIPSSIIEIPFIAGPNPDFNTACNGGSCGTLSTTSFPSLNGGLGWAGLDDDTANYQFGLYALSSALPVAPTAIELDNNTSGLVLDRQYLTARGVRIFALRSSQANNGFDRSNGIAPIAFSSTRDHGRSFFPQISWSAVPAAATSLLLIVRDNTSSMAKLIIRNISTVKAGNQIENNDGSLAAMQTNGTLVPNSYDIANGGWTGFESSHNYTFNLYALNATGVAALASLDRNSYTTWASTNATGIVVRSPDLNITGAPAFNLTSSVARNGFNAGETMSLEFSNRSDGGLGRFPALDWVSGAGASNYALIVYDLNAPATPRLLINAISSDTSSISKNDGSNANATGLGSIGTLVTPAGFTPARAAGNYVFRLVAYRGTPATALTTANFATWDTLPANRNFILGSSELRSTASPSFLLVSSLGAAAGTDGFMPGLNAIMPTAFVKTSLGGLGRFPRLAWTSAFGASSYVLVVRQTNNSNAHLLLQGINGTVWNIPNNDGSAGATGFNGIGTLVTNNAALPAVSTWIAANANQQYNYRLYAMNAATTPGLSVANYNTFETTFANNVLGVSEIWASTGNAFTLTSSASNDGVDDADVASLRFSTVTFGGRNAFPRVSWSADIPTGTQQFVLVVSDTTATPRANLILRGISNARTFIPLNDGTSGATGFGATGTPVMNSYGTTGWTGFAPGVNYRFRLFVLNTAADPGITAANFTTWADGNASVLGGTEITATGAPAFNLTSSVARNGFNAGETMSLEFSNRSDGGLGRFPALDWVSGAGASNYALIVYDLNAPATPRLLINAISSDTSSISKNDGSNANATGLGSVGTLVTPAGFIPARAAGNYVFRLVAYRGTPATALTTANFATWDTLPANRNFILGSSELRSTASPSFLLVSSLGAAAGTDGFMPGLNAIMPTAFVKTSLGGLGRFPRLAWTSAFGASSYVLVVRQTNNSNAHLLLQGINGTVWNIPNNDGSAGATGFNGIGTLVTNNAALPAVSTWIAANANQQYNYRLYAMNTATTPGLSVANYNTFETTFANNVLGVSEIWASTGNAFTLTSSASNDGVDDADVASLRFSTVTFGGRNAFPRVSWSADIPTGTQQFVLVVSDTTATPRANLILRGISNARTFIPLNDGTSGATGFGATGTPVMNSYGTTGWTGFAPGVNYRFRLFVLNTAADPGITAANFTTWADGNASVLGGTEITATGAPAFNLTSSVARNGFNAGETMSLEFSNRSDGGLGRFPALDWVSGAGASNYALIVYDLNAPATPRLLINAISSDTSSISKNDGSNANATGLGSIGTLVTPAGFTPARAAGNYVFRLVAYRGTPATALTTANFATWDTLPANRNFILGSSELRSTASPSFLLVSSLGAAAGTDGFMPGLNAIMPTAFVKTSLGGLGRFPRLAWTSAFGASSYVLVVRQTNNSNAHLLLQGINGTVWNIPNNDGSAGATGFNGIGTLVTNNAALPAVSTWIAANANQQYNYRLYAMNTATTPGLSVANYNTFETTFANNVLGVSEIWASTGNAFTLTSSASNDGVDDADVASLRFSTVTFGGRNAFPRVSWSADIPTGTQQFVLVVSDTTATPRANLILRGISNARTFIPLNDGTSGATGFGATGTPVMNSYGTTGWTGFAPGVNYRFRLFVLNTAADPGITAANFTTWADGNASVLGGTEITATGAPAFNLDIGNTDTEGLDANTRLFPMFSDTGSGGYGYFPRLIWNSAVGATRYSLIVLDSANVARLIVSNLNGSSLGVSKNAGTAANFNAIGNQVIAWSPPSANTTYTFKVIAHGNVPAGSPLTAANFTTWENNNFIVSVATVRATSAPGFTVSSSDFANNSVLPMSFNKMSDGGVANFPNIMWPRVTGARGYALVVRDATTGTSYLLLSGIGQNRLRVQRNDGLRANNFGDSDGQAQALSADGDFWNAFDALRTYTFRVFALSQNPTTALSRTNVATWETDNNSPNTGIILAVNQIRAQAGGPFRLSSSQTDNGFNANSSVLPVEFASSNLGGRGRFPKLTWNSSDQATQYALIVSDNLGRAHALINGMSLTAGSGVLNKTDGSVAANFGGSGGTAIQNPADGNRFWSGFSQNPSLYTFRLYALNQAPNPALTYANFSTWPTLGDNPSRIIGTSVLTVGGVQPFVLASGNVDVVSRRIENEFNDTDLNGRSRFPELTWMSAHFASNYALIVSSLGAVNRAHLLVENIPPSAFRILKNNGNNADFSIGASLFRLNSFARAGWTGLFPNSNYIFKLVAYNGAPTTSLTSVNFDTWDNDATVIGVSTIRVLTAPRFVLSSPHIDATGSFFRLAVAKANGGDAIFPRLSWTSAWGATSYTVLVWASTAPNAPALILTGIPRTTLSVNSTAGTASANFGDSGGNAQAIAADASFWNGFIPSTYYRIRVYALNAAPTTALTRANHLTWEGTNSSVIIGSSELVGLTPFLVPVQVTGLTISLNAMNQAVLSWNAAFNATDYNIYRSYNSSVDTSTIVPVNTSTLNYTDTTLLAGSMHYYALKSRNHIGESDLASATVSVLARPAPPALFDVNARPTYIFLSWASSRGTSPISYKIYRSSVSANISTAGAPLATVSVATFSDVSVVNNQVYYYTILSNNASGDSLLTSRTLSVTSFPTPPASVDITTTAYSTVVGLSWTLVNGATSYNIYRSAINPVQITAANRIGNTLVGSYNDTSTLNSRVYYYVVTNVNPAGESLASVLATPNPTTIITTPPRVLMTTAVNWLSVGLSWSAPGSGGATSYKVYRDTSPLVSTSSPLLATGIASTTYNDRTIALSTSYHYLVVATNTGGDSLASNVIMATTPPAKPTSLSATASTERSNSIVLNWTPGNTVTHYNIYFTTVSSGFTPSAANRLVDNQRVSASATQVHWHSNLQSGTSYYYKITSVNAGGESEPADITVLTLPTQPSIASVGSRFDATDTAGSGARVNINNVTGASSYTIHRDSTVAFAVTPANRIGSVARVAGATTVYTDNNVSAANTTNYHYRVIAENTSGSSPASSSVLFPVTIFRIAHSRVTTTRASTIFKLNLTGQGFPWSASGIPSWISLTKNRGGGLTDEITITVAAQGSTAFARSATIVFSTQGISRNLVINQAGAGTVDPDNPDSIIFTNVGTNTTIELPDDIRTIFVTVVSGSGGNGGGSGSSTRNGNEASVLGNRGQVRTQWCSIAVANTADEITYFIGRRGNNGGDGRNSNLSPRFGGGGGIGVAGVNPLIAGTQGQPTGAEASAVAGCGSAGGGGSSGQVTALAVGPATWRVVAVAGATGGRGANACTGGTPTYNGGAGGIGTGGNVAGEVNTIFCTPVVVTELPAGSAPTDGRITVTPVR